VGLKSDLYSQLAFCQFFDTVGWVIWPAKTVLEMILMC